LKDSNCFYSLPKQFPRVKQFVEKTAQFAKQSLSVTTISGRLRLLKGFSSTKGAVRAKSDRQSVNSMVQGSAADIMKQAMIKLSSAIKGTLAKIVLQIHDELVVFILLLFPFNIAY